MKLLFDQNLSYKLCSNLAAVFPGSNHVRLIGLDRAQDRVVWRLAAEQDYVLVTQDADFRELSTLYGSPPKVVLLRCGNQPTTVISALLLSAADSISALEADSEIHVLEIG